VKPLLVLVCVSLADESLELIHLVSPKKRDSFATIPALL
jgi:hypothetical protein